MRGIVGGVAGLGGLFALALWMAGQAIASRFLAVGGVFALIWLIWVLIDHRDRPKDGPTGG